MSKYICRVITSVYEIRNQDVFWNYLLGDVFTQLVVRLFVMEWYSFLCLLLFQLWNSFADNLFNKQNCRNHFLCHPASLRMFATTWKQTNWSGFPKFPLNPLFPLTSNFLRWGNIWSLDSFSEDTTNTIANINLTAALIGLLWIQVLGSFAKHLDEGTCESQSCDDFWH